MLRLSRLPVLFAVFVMLGLPEGAIGTAWPSMRLTYGQAESRLSVLLIAYVGGYVIASPQTARLAATTGLTGATRAGVAVTAAGLGLHLISPTWWIAVAASLILGCGAGLVDTSVNTDVAANDGSRTMNLLHASFGVGATFGPLLMAALLVGGAPWRSVFAVLMVLELGLLIAVGSGALDGSTGGDRDENEAAMGAQQRSPRPGVTLAATLVFFAIYVATEVSIGQWTFTLLTEAEGVGDGTAGLTVAGYWGGLTAGRFAWAAVGDRADPLRLLLGSMVLLVGGTLWFWSTLPGRLLALAACGLALSGMFPAMVLLSARWFEPDQLTRAVGRQLAASGIGSILAALALGRLTDTSGLDVLPPAFVVLALGVVAAIVATRWSARPTPATR